MSAEYGADQIQILEGLEAVRKRPGMYIGSTSSRGLHHLVYEIVDNSVDEALAGFCKNIDVTIQKDNSITVTDDGRGIPVGINHKAGIPAVEVVFTVLHAGGKFGGGGYKVSGGLHGVGASVVNALSEWLEVRICSEGRIYFQRYERGHVVEPLKVIGECDPEKTGTQVSFLPDKEIFEETVYDYDVLKVRLREMAFLTKGLNIILRDDRQEPQYKKEFCYEGGIKEFVSYLNRSKTALYDQIIYCEGTVNDVVVEVALQHNDSYTENCYSFVNNINTPEGGTHLTGFKNALTKTFNDYARKNKLLKDSEPSLNGDDIREGLTAIISIKIGEPQFEGQTKQKLGNSEARGAVDNVVSEQLMIFLEQNFWENHVLTRTPPPYTEDGDLVIESVRRYTGPADKEAPAVSLDLSLTAKLMRFLQLQEQKKGAEAGKKEIEEDMKRLKAAIIAKMGKSCQAICQQDGVNYTVTYNPIRTPGIDKDNLKRLKLDHPDIYEQYVTVSVSRRFVVKCDGEAA